MGNASEEGRSSPIQKLLPISTKVVISYRNGSLGLEGEGIPALKQLVQSYGQQGIDAFNEAFITPGFERDLWRRIHSLTQEIVDLAPQDHLPHIAWLRGGYNVEKIALRRLARRIKRREEVLIPLRNGGERDSQQRLYSGKIPPEDEIYINLKNPSRPAVAQPNP